MRVAILRYTDGSTAFQLGSAGTPFVYDGSDADSVAVAFTKAVNEGVESGADIEGEAAVAVAEVLKAAGDRVWPAYGGYASLQQAVGAALPKPANRDGYPMSYPYVMDIALDGQTALVCGYDLDGDGDSDYYVVPFDVHGDGDDLTVVVGDRSSWVEVEQDYVAKSGRVFSGRNLSAMREAHEALGALIALGAEKPEEPEEEPKLTSEMSYSVTKANAAMRYTLGPLYAPMREDAHGEWIEDEELHKSLHEFVRDSADNGRRINLQHGEKGNVQCGEWVEAVRWPYEHTIKMIGSDGVENEVEMPAGTVYLGVVWDEDYWDVKKNAPKGLTGYSLGGRAVKVRGTSETLKDMGYKVRKTAATTTAPARDHDIDLAVEVGKADAERKAYSGLSERLLDVLTKHAENGVTINENAAPGLESLLKE